MKCIIRTIWPDPTILADMNRLRCVAVSFLVVVVITVPARAAVVKYTELTSTRLPYGEAITIVGKLGDLKRGPRRLQNSMDIQSISLNYQVSGLAEKSAAAAIMGDAWQVAVEKLPEKAQVQFRFQITGQLTENKVETVIDGLVTNPEFKTALQGFFESAHGKEPATQALHAESFAKAITPIVNGLLSDVEAVVKDILSQHLVRLIGPLANLRTRIDDLEGDVPGITKGMAPSEAVKKIKEALRKWGNDYNCKQDEDVVNNAERFVASYKKEFKLPLQKTIQTNISVKTDLSAVTEIRDFEKFAGIDVGAIYVRKIDELRSFYTVNIYFGTVEDTPPPATSPQSFSASGSEISTACKILRFLQQRLSLTFGATIGDISSGPQKEIKGNNAFLCGLGFRFNKYFRITAGTTLYRSAHDDRLRNEFYVGPSVDISALPFLRTLVGKNKN